MRLTPYLSPATFTSRVFDGGAQVTWSTAAWTADLPAGTTVTVSVRTGNTAVPDASWTAFSVVPSPGGAIGGTSRYIQYRLELSSTVPGQSPAVRDVTLNGSS
jgi:hypothetical protein